MNGKLTKNGLVVLAVLAVVAALIGGDLLWGYWHGVQGVVRNELRDATSVRFDLARLDQTIEGLGPVLRKNEKKAIEMKVGIECLEADTASIQKRQALAKAEMEELRGALRKESERIEIDRREFTRTEVEADLLRRLRAYEQTEKQLKTRQNILAKQRATFDKLNAGIKDEEQQLVALEQTADALNAELGLLEVAATTSQFEFESTELVKAKELAKAIEKRIRTLQRLCDRDSPQPGIPVNRDRRTAAQQFDERFSKENQ